MNLRKREYMYYCKLYRILYSHIGLLSLSNDAGSASTAVLFPVVRAKGISSYTTYIGVKKSIHFIL